MFGRVEQAIKQSEDNFLAMEIAFEQQPSVENRGRLIQAQAEVSEKLKVEEEL